MPRTSATPESSGLPDGRSNLVLALLGVALVGLVVFGVLSQRGGEYVIAADLGGVQYAELEAMPEAYPTRVEVRANEPVQLAVQRTQSDDYLVFPELAVSRDLSARVTVITLAPLKPGRYRFNSRKGYVRGVLVAH